MCARLIGHPRDSGPRAAAHSSICGGHVVSQAFHPEQESLGFEQLKRFRAGLPSPAAVPGSQGGDARRVIAGPQCPVFDAATQMGGQLDIFAGIPLRSRVLKDYHVGDNSR